MAVTNVKIGNYVRVRVIATGKSYNGLVTAVMTPNDENDPGQKLLAAMTPRLSVVYVVDNGNGTSTVTTASLIPNQAQIQSGDTMCYQHWMSV